MELTYPSALSPAPPSFRMTFPPGWEERPHATAAAFAVDSNSPEGFHVNVIVLTTRVLADASLDTLVEELQAAPGVASMKPDLQGRRHDTINGHDAVLSAMTLNAEKLPFPLFQTQAAVLLPLEVPYLVHAYATCPAAAADEYATTFRAIFATLRF
jgi:hypothetical protein